MAEVKAKDLSTYTIEGLYAAGLRFTDDYTRGDAIAQYMALHPEADENAIRNELDDALD